MRNLFKFALCATVAMTFASSQAIAQCPTCAGSAPSFSSAPVQSYASPVYSAPAQSYASPVYSAPVQSYAAPAYSAPVQYSSAPVVSGGCSSCCGGSSYGGSMDGTMVSGGMSPYSTQGLPPGAVVISDVVVGEGEATSEGQAVEGTVVGDTGSSSEAANPPVPQPEGDSVVPPLPTEDAAEGEATDDGT